MVRGKLFLSSTAIVAALVTTCLAGRQIARFVENRVPKEPFLSFKYFTASRAAPVEYHRPDLETRVVTTVARAVFLHATDVNAHLDGRGPARWSIRAVPQENHTLFSHLDSRACSLAELTIAELLRENIQKVLRKPLPWTPSSGT